MNYKIGIDVGGTKLESVLLTDDNREIHRKRIPTPRDRQYQSILSAVHSLCMDTILKIQENQNFTIGIGIPGTVDAATQLVQNANTTCLIDQPFQKDLEDLLNRKITMDNDANCFTLAESMCGAGKDYELVFGIIMGTGCGGGICLNGSIRQGSHGIAGEWGHFSIDPHGLQCYCGNSGCIETKISGSGVETSFYNTYGYRLSMNEIVQGYRDKNPHCKKAFLTFLDDFGRALGGLISILDPDAVVIGGGLSKIDELYGPGIERVRQYAFHRHIKTPILINELGDSAGVLGAAWIGI